MLTSITTRYVESDAGSAAASDDDAAEEEDDEVEGEDDDEEKSAGDKKGTRNMPCRLDSRANSLALPSQRPSLLPQRNARPRPCRKR
jgi:hypothetical protein